MTILYFCKRCGPVNFHRVDDDECKDCGELIYGTQAAAARAAERDTARGIASVAPLVVKKINGKVPPVVEKALRAIEKTPSSKRRVSMLVGPTGEA